MDKNEVVETEKNEELEDVEKVFKLGKWRIGRAVDPADQDANDDGEGKKEGKAKKILKKVGKVALPVVGLVTLGAVAGCALGHRGDEEAAFEGEDYLLEDGFGDQIEVEAETVESVED